MSYSVYRHEGGKKVKVEGPFDSKEKAQEIASEKNSKIDIPRGGFKVHED